MQDRGPRLTEYHHPATFRARGVAAPFTTPMLAGARVRGAAQGGVELVVANPSGGRGLCILPWREVRTLCAPTVHDTVLLQRFARLPTIDPACVRRAALEVAAEGFAGRAAISAAAASTASDREERGIAAAGLLTRLLEQHGLTDGKFADAADRWPDLVLHRLAPSFGWPASRLASDLRAVADAFAPLGNGRGDHKARIPRLIARLEATSGGLFAWLDDIKEIGGLCRSIAEVMQAAASAAATVLRVVRATLSDATNLLKRWASQSTEALASASRCEWLLDGWERVCLLWALAATDAARQAAVLEMAPLVPVLPGEVADWTDVAIPSQAMTEICRVIQGQNAPLSAAATFAWIQRNEQLRAMSS